MTTDPLAELLDSEPFRRYLGGRELPEDAADLRRLAERAGLALDDLAGLKATVEKGELWRRVASKTGLDPELVWRQPAAEADDKARATDLPVRRRLASRWAGLAAAVAIAVSGLLSWRWLSDARLERAVPVHVVAAPSGQRIQYRLPDGSRVVLAPETELRLVGWRASGPREVTLVGEAYFDVVHDEARPFRVRLGNAIVEDLGTEFFVRRYPDDESGRVAVRSGLVAVRPQAALGSASTKLGPGDVAEVRTDGQALRTVADTSALFGWLDGQLTFHDAPLSLVLRGLARWYGVRVTAADSALQATQLTLTILDRNTPAEAVAYVAALANARVEHRGSAFVLVRQ